MQSFMDQPVRIQFIHDVHMTGDAGAGVWYQRRVEFCVRNKGNFVETFRGSR